jgi:dTMP kinase
MKKHRGILITFEGVDGSGKSTQARRLVRLLKAQGYPVLFVREPGGTPASEQVRRILLDRRLDISPISELLLYEAARAHLTERVIIPALTKGTIVVCDRFTDSTVAYQGYGRGLDLAFVERLNRVSSAGISPDLTFIFDIDYKTSLSRRRRQADRLEKESRAFFERVRAGFKSFGAHKRVVMLDGRDERAALFELVERRCLRLIARRIGGRAR